MPSLIRKEKITCENCGTHTTRNNIVRHRKRCSSGTLYFNHCPISSTKSQSDLNYHIAKKHSVPKPNITFKCKLCNEEFPGSCALRQHRNTQHGMQIGSGTRDADVEHRVGDFEDHRLREEMRSCQQFLVDSELERARHKVFNYAVETLNETIVNEKLDLFLNNLKYAAKVNLAFGFILKNIEDGGFKKFYAHENNTLLDRSKVVCTHDDLAKLKDFLNKTDVIESFSRERINTKWRFYKLLLYSKTYLWGAGTQFYPNLRSKITQSTVSGMKKIQDSHITTTCAFFVLLLSTCTEVNNWKKKLRNDSIYSSIKWMG